MIKDYLHPLWGKSIRGLSYPDGKANDAFIDALQQDIDTGEKDMYLAKLSAFLDTATGKWLDYWGEWLGLHRNQRNDDGYRSALKKHVLHSRNTIDAIRDAVATYLDTNRNRIYVYEPYRDMFIYNSSNWNTYKFYPSVYYRYAVIDVKIDHPIDGVVAQIINLFRPAGVIFVITNLINVLNDNAPIIDFSVDASNNIISNDFDYVGFTQNNFVVLSPSLDAVLDNDEEPFTYNKDSWNGGKKYASGTYGSGLLQYASMFQTDQHIHKYPENLVDYSRITTSYQAKIDVNTEYSDGIAKNAEIAVTCGTNDNSKNGWGDGICFDTKPLGESKNTGWNQWYVISGIIKAEFDGAHFRCDINSYPFDLGGEYGNDHDLRSKAIIRVFNGESYNSGDDCNIPKGKWCPFYIAWYNGDDSSNTANPNHSVMYDQTQINVRNSNGVEGAQYKIRDFYTRVVDNPSLQEVWVPGSYSTLLYDSPNDTASAEYAKQGLYDSVDTRYAKYTKVNEKPVIGYVDFLSAYSATKFNKLNIDYSGYTGTQSEKLVQALKPMSVKSLSLYAKVARNSAELTLRVFNYKLSLWEIFGTYTLTSTDYTYITHDFYDLSNYVNPVTGLLTFSLLSNNDTDVYIDYYSFTIGSKTDGIYELSTAQFYDNVPLGALTSYSKIGFTDAHYPVTGTAVTDKDKLYRVRTLRTVWDSSHDLQGSGTDFKVGIPELHHTGKNSSQSDSYMVVTYTHDNGKLAPFSSAKLGSISFDLSTENVSLVGATKGGGRNLVRGTAEPYVMGYGIPNTIWKDGYAYLKLPSNTPSSEVLPQAPHTFYHVLTKGTTYTQTVWLETDATVKDLSVASITWFTSVGHDWQHAKLINLGENKYKLVSTYTWPGKSNNNVRLFDISGLNYAFDLSTGTYLKFGKLKLEEGDASTDWQPAPEDLGANKYVCVYQMPLYEDNKQSADLFATLVNENIKINRVQVLSYFDNEVLNKDAYNYHLEKVHYNNIDSSDSVFGGIDKDDEMYIRVKSSVPNVFGVGPYYLPGFNSESESKYATVSADISGKGYLTRAVLEGNTPPVGYYNLVKYSTRDIFVTAKGDSPSVFVTPEIFPMTNGETYTISFTPSTSDVADDDTSDISKFSIRILDTKATGKEVASLIDTADGKVHSLTFTIPTDGDNYGIYLYAGKWGASLVGSSYFTTIYHHIMLEKGSVAHAWSPNPWSVGVELNPETYTSISNTFSPVSSNNSPYTLYLSDYYAKYTKSNNLILNSPTNMVYENHTKGSGWTGSKYWGLTLNKGKYYFIGYINNDTTKDSNDSYALRVNADTSSGITLLSTGTDAMAGHGYILSQPQSSEKQGWLSISFNVPNDNTEVTVFPWSSMWDTGEGRIGYSHLGLYNFDSFARDPYMDAGFASSRLLDYKYKNMKTEYGVVATKPVDRSVHESLNVNTDLYYNNSSYWNNLSSYTKAGIKDPDGDTPVYTTALNTGLSTNWYMLEPNTWYKVSTWAKLPNNTGRRLAWTFYNSSAYMSVWDSDTAKYSQDSLASNQYLVATDSKDWFKTSALFYTGSGFDKHIPELQMINGSGTLYQGPIVLTKVKQSGENLLPSFHQIIESNNYSQRTFNEVWNVIKNSNENAYSQSTTNSDADTLSLKGDSELYINTATTANINSYLSVVVTNDTNKDVSLVVSYAGDSQTYVVKANASLKINRSFTANENGYSILSFKANGDLTLRNPSMII